MTERVLGPTGSRRRKRTLLLPALVILAAAIVFGVSAAVGASLPGSNFEIDTNANLKVDGTAPPALDWANVTEIRRTDLPTGQTDDSYKGGMKEDTACPETETGSIPNNKSDLINFGSYFEPESGGPGWLHVFWRRVQEPSGTTNMDFEFNKSTTDCDGAGGSSKNVTRTIGDILLQFDVDQGGAVAHLSKRTWLGSAWSDPPTPLTANDAIGDINDTTIPSGEADGLGAISPRTFGEASFDLSQVFDPTKCESFGSAMLKSRSSDSFTSQLKDFIAPVPVNITNCGTVIIRKVTDPAGDSTNFGYTKAFSTDPSSTNTFQLNGASGTNSKTFTGVLFGNGLTVTEDSPLPTSWEFVSLVCSASSASVPPADRVVTGQTVTFKIDNSADILDCTYTNRLRQGAIKITKTSDKSGNGLSGAGFSITGPNSFSTTKSTGSDGTVCVDGLAWGDYTVTETSVPTGFNLDDSTGHTVTVNNNAKCSDSPYVGETISFSDTPLADIQVRFRDGGSGETALENPLSCDNATGTSSGANTTGWNNTLTVTGIKVDGSAVITITCTIEIDP